jgi:DNA-directed RNA polymerase specialized sigma24 family protein
MSSRPPGMSRVSEKLAAIDADLVERVAQGEQCAFDSIYDTLFPLVWSLSLRRVGLEQIDAEQLTERILERVLLALPQYPPAQPFAEWLGAQIAKELHAFERAERPRGVSARRVPMQPRR